MGKKVKDAPAFLMAGIFSTGGASAFNRRSKVDKGRWLKSFRRPMIFRVKFPDCIKPSKSTPFGLEDREYVENGNLEVERRA